MERVAADDAVADAFCKRLFSWSTRDEYEAIRDSLITEMGLAEDGEFLRTFMPPVPEMTGYDGKPWNIIDGGALDMDYRGLESYVVGISGDRYTYLARVKVASTDSDGHVGEGEMMMQYTVDSAGTISDLTGFGLASSGF